MHAASIWGEGKFCLDREFSKNAPYKQKIIFHLASSDKMEQKKFFFAWTVDRWYLEVVTDIDINIVQWVIFEFETPFSFSLVGP